jgi:CheY-like chemotaxis protein
VLVVDDDRDIRYILRQWLENLGALVREANDGLDALAQVERSRPDLIICDVAMPRLDGCRVVERLKADPALARIPVIALTGLDAPDTVLRTLEAGFDGHLVKPITKDILAAQLDRYLKPNPPA